MSLEKTPARQRLATAALLFAAIGGGLLPASVSHAADEGIRVIIDRAKVMRVSRPADIVIIGNPAIADATIQDSQTLIITGRSFGTTNLIVLDSGGQAIADEIVRVSSANDDVVTIYKRAARETLSCTPDCSPTATIGDTAATFDTVSGQVESYSGLTDAASQK
ncbi:MAG: pilus assembly protein CpaC [Bauldia sp.]|nr:MAG: pilus assembly protein CpaC [Bauldia sp.]MBZ0227320.1 pilus assembly protein N-terminal domain-containing protein [Bauldia sp.]